MQKSAQVSLHRLEAVFAAVFLALSIGVMGAPTAPAYADPSRPVTVDSHFNTETAQLGAWAVDGLADEAWNVAFEVQQDNTSMWFQGIKHIGPDHWDVVIPFNQLGTGTWTINAYANVASEPVQLLGTSQVYIEPLDAEIAMDYPIEFEHPLLELYVYDVSCPTGIQAVSAGVTSPSGATVWVPLKGSGTNWWAEIDPMVFGYEPGIYTVDVAVADNQWKGHAVPAKTIDFFYASDEWGTQISGDQIELWTEGVRAANAWNVAFCVVGANGTQWIQGEQTSGDLWLATVDPRTIGNGSFTAWPVYAVADAPLTTGTPQTIPNVLIDVSPTIYYLDGDRVFEIDIFEPQCAVGDIEAISVGLTGPDGTCEWFPVTLSPIDNSWLGRIPADVYGYMTGEYTIDVAVADTDWNVYSSGPYTVNPFTDEQLYAFYDDNQDVEMVESFGGRISDAWNAAFVIHAPDGDVWLQGIHDYTWSAPIPDTLMGEFLNNGLDVSLYINIDDQTLYVLSDHLDALIA